MSRVLVTEAIAQNGLDRLAAAGHEVDVRLGLSAEELVDAIVGAHGLIIRSATQVTADVLSAADQLVVVGRAGIGLDNVDTDAATQAGVMVVNAPQSNVLSAAEHTMAMLLAQARNVPQAHAALIEGRWERSKWNGVELSDKTLGIVGLGRIGRLVAQRALAFGMRLVAFDPFVSADAARQISVEMLDLAELMANADFVTLHLARTPETVGLIDADILAGAKPTLRIVNVARGGIIDEAALYDALRSGTIAGAALDVFATEPCTESPLFQLDNVVVTPHLGASTVEAQDKAGETIADMVLLALAGDFVPFAVNIAAGDVAESVRPFQSLAEKLGDVFAGLVGAAPDTLEIRYAGELAQQDCRILTLSALKGFFGRGSDTPVSYVNAPQAAEERGIEVQASAVADADEFVNLITIRGGGHEVSGTLAGVSGKARIVGIDGCSVDVPPAESMVVVRNADVPGMIGRVATALGDAGLNISDMAVGKDSAGSSALMVISLDSEPGLDVVASIGAIDGVRSVATI